MARKGRTKVIYKGTFISKQSLVTIMRIICTISHFVKCRLGKQFLTKMYSGSQQGMYRERKNLNFEKNASKWFVAEIEKKTQNTFCPQFPETQIVPHFRYFLNVHHIIQNLE
jgi:hypothetical protein